MTTIEEQLSALRRIQSETEARQAQGSALWRHALDEIEEQVRELRREVQTQEFRTWTEEEFAALFKVSESTMKRLRRKHQLDHILVGVQVRYSPANLESAQQKLAAAAKNEKSKSGGKPTFLTASRRGRARPQRLEIREGASHAS